MVSIPMDEETKSPQEGSCLNLSSSTIKDEIGSPDDDYQGEEKDSVTSATQFEDTNSPLERICRVLSSKTKAEEAEGHDDDCQGEEKGESLPNPVTSALQYRFKCDKCEQSFSSKGSCWNHKKRVHPTDDDLTKHWHTCEKCGKSFFYKKQYDNHVLGCQGSDKSATLYRCPMCPFTCFDKVDLADHVMDHDSPEADDANSDEQPVGADSPYARDSNGQYEADVPTPSPALYIDETDNMNMMNAIEQSIVQSEKGTWQCPSCPIRCTEKEDVKAHLRDRHLNKVRKHVCNICMRGFTHSSGLKQHITRVHGVPGPPPDPDGAKFFKCGLCGKAFSLVRSLISHWPTHKLQTSSSLENFQCIICKAFFQLPSQLQDHFIKQHPQEATSGSVTPVGEKRPPPDDPPYAHPPIKMEKMDDSTVDDGCARGIPGFLSSRQCQNSFDSDDQPVNPPRKVRATTSTSSPTTRSSHAYQSSVISRGAEADEGPPSLQKEPVVDEDTEPTSSQSCVSCMEKSGHLLSNCKHCGIYFTDFVMHTLHMGLHGQDHPFQCHHCGKNCGDKYNFFTHIYRESHL